MNGIVLETTQTRKLAVALRACSVIEFVPLINGTVIRNATIYLKKEA